VLVTRASSDGDLGSEVSGQLFCLPRPMIMTGSMLAAVGLIPGLPFFPFATIGGISVGMGYLMAAKQKKLAESPAGALPGSGPAGQLGHQEGKADESKADKPAEPTVKAYKQILSVSPMELKIGFGLVSLVDREQGGNLIDRIGNVRQQVAEELGFVVPPVNVQDDMSIGSCEYRILVRGLEVARYSMVAGNMLAIDPAGEVELDDLQQTVDPSFGFSAYWVPPHRRDYAESRGLTLVDHAGVITTHLATVVRAHAAELLGRQDVSDLVEQLKEKHSAVVEELIPEKLSIGVVHRILQNF
jgi:Flagellar biosynthesis pathway, component FlhA